MKSSQLAALLSLVLIAPGRTQNTVDDWPNLPPGAALPILADGTGSASGRIQYATDTDAFNFMVASPAQLTVYTTGTTDTNGVLKRASFTAAGTSGWVTVATEENGTDNFRISARVEPGQYAIQVGGRLSTTSNGAYGLRVELSPVVTLPPDIDLPDAAKGSTQDFGIADAGTSVRRGFTLKNTGGSTLTINGIALLNATAGASAGPFLLDGAGARTIAPGASSTFAVQFRPLAAGEWTSTVRIVSNDADESPWDFSITGRGSDAPPPPQAPEIAAFSGASELQTGGTVSFGVVPVPSAADAVREVVIANKGTAPLSLGNVRIELLPLGAPLPSAPDGFFKVLTQPAASVDAGRSTVIRFGAGLRDALADPAMARFMAYAVIGNNDSDENPFRLLLSADRQTTLPPVAPELDLFSGTDSVASGSTINMGATSPSGVISKVFVIRNTGTASLNISGIGLPPGVIAPAVIGPFYVEGSAARTVAPGASSEFRVTFKSIIPGTFTGALGIMSNDADENPYLLTLTGTVAGDPVGVPEIGVSTADSDLPSGSTLDFGTALPLETVRRTIRVANTGTGILNVRFGLQSLTRSNIAFAAPFRFLSATFSSVPAGTTRELTIGFVPPAADTYSVNLIISNNDADENPYSIRLTGAAKDAGTRAPEIALSLGDAEIASGGVVDFGSTSPGRGVIRELQVTNKGDGVLKLGRVTLTRPGETAAAGDARVNAGGIRPHWPSLMAFRVLSPSAVLVPPGEKAVVRVLFMPPSPGAHQALLCIESNDADENPYKINLKGASSVPVPAPPEIEVFAGETPLPAGGDLMFGDVKIGTPVRRTVRIANTGTGDLRVTSFLAMPVSVEPVGGDAAGGFIPTAALVRVVSGVSVIAPGASGEFVLEMLGYSPGAARFAARIASNDADENPYGFKISGTVSAPDPVNPAAILPEAD